MRARAHTAAHAHVRTSMYKRWEGWHNESAPPYPQASPPRRRWKDGERMSRGPRWRPRDAEHDGWERRTERTVGGGTGGWTGTAQMRTVTWRAQNEKPLPIWTLGDPHSASRHKSATTNSSFMAAAVVLARRHSSLLAAGPTDAWRGSGSELCGWCPVLARRGCACRCCWTVRARADERLGIPMRHERENREQPRAEREAASARANKWGHGKWIAQYVYVMTPHSKHVKWPPAIINICILYIAIGPWQMIQYYESFAPVLCCPNLIIRWYTHMLGWITWT